MLNVLFVVLLPNINLKISINGLNLLYCYLPRIMLPFKLDKHRFLFKS